MFSLCVGGWVCVNMHTVHVNAWSRMWRSENNFEKYALSFYLVDLRYGTEVIRLGSKCPTHWAALPVTVWVFCLFLLLVCFIFSLANIQFWKQAFCLLTSHHIEGLAFHTYLHACLFVSSGSWDHVVRCVPPGAPWCLLLRLLDFV